MKISYLIARIIATITSAFYLWFFVNESFDGGSPTTAGIILIIILLFLALATIVAWFRDDIGSMLLLVSGIIFSLFSIFVAQNNAIAISIITGGPIILAAVMLGVLKEEVRSIIVPPKREITTQE